DSEKAMKYVRVGGPDINRNLLAIAGRLVHIAGWALELPDRQLLWSEHIYKLLHFTPDVTLTLDQAIDLFTPPGRDVLKAAIERCASEGIAFDEELEIRNAHGDLRAVRLIGEPQRDEQGRIVRIEGAFQDITERKQALEGLIS